MLIDVDLTEAQLKALLSEEVSVEACVNRILTNRADRIIDRIVKNYGNRLVGITVKEKAALSAITAGKVIVDPSQLPRDIKEIIVKRAPIKSMAEKIKEEQTKKAALWKRATL